MPDLIEYYNKGRRTFDFTKATKPNEPTPAPRRFGPDSRLALTPEEAEIAKRYPRELMEVSKLPAGIDARKLQADNAALKAKNDELEKQLAALQAKPEESKQESPKQSSGKQK